MRVGGHGHAGDLGADIGAPGIGVGKEKLLAVSPAVLTLIVQRLSLLLQSDFERIQGQVDATIVSSVFALAEQAILFNPGAGFRHFLRVFVGAALTALVVLFAIFRRPPVAEIAVSVKLASLIVEAMDDFVTYNHANGAVVHSVVFRGVEERWLQ